MTLLEKLKLITHLVSFGHITEFEAEVMRADAHNNASDEEE